MKRQGPDKLHSSSCEVFDSQGPCLQLYHFVLQNKPVSNNCFTTVTPTIIRTVRKFKKKSWILSSQWILMRFFKVWSFWLVIVSLWSTAIFNICDTSCLSCCLIYRQHVMIPRCSNMADPKRPMKLHWKQNNILAIKVLLKLGMSEYSQACYKVLTDRYSNCC